MKEFFHFIKEWSNTISSFAMVFSIFYVVVTTRENLNLVSEALNATNEQLSLQKKSIPAQFVMLYKNINSSGEQAFITNTGKTNLKKVITEWEYYFIDKKDKIYLGSNMKNIVTLDSNLLNRILNNEFYDLISSPSDFDGLFGTGRKFDISFLNAKEKNIEINNSETLLDISSSSIQNALKLNLILGTEMFMRWRIKYNEELSNKEKITYNYIWFNDSENNYGERLDLQNLIGGKRIIKLISDYEINTKEIIFGKI